jgi:hypothetical protein
MSKTSKINLYTKYDIDVIGDNIDILKKEAENFVAENYEQTAADFRDTIKIIEQFVKSKNRITYGGYALNKLLINKDPSKAIYNKYSKPDIDFYTPEPLQDLKELCDLLLSKKVIDPRAQQAQHGDTYKLFINYDDGGDISYVPLHIYNKMPTITIDGIRYIHPKFMYIDYLRMYTDPLMSWFRIEKAIPRGMTLLESFPLEVGTEKIVYEELTKNSSVIMGDLSKILSEVETIIHIGTYAVQFMTLNKEKLVLPYEVISVEYNTDVRKIYNQLVESGYKIELKEYFPYFQFWDRHLEFIYNSEVVLTVYNNNQRCIPYRRYESGNMASFQQILMHHLIKYYYFLNNKIETANINNTLGELIRTRNDYLKKNNKTVMDDTMYREFMISCLGKAFDARRQQFLDYKKKREQGKRTLYRYDPQENFHDKLPNYIFDNTSGNIINNPKLYTIQTKNSDVKLKRLSKKSSKKSSKRSSKKSSRKNKRSLAEEVVEIDMNKTETKYPFDDPLLSPYSQYTSEAY